MKSPDTIPNDPETTDAIAAWCERHEDDAATWLVARYRPLVAGIAHRRMPTWALAEDVVQDVLTQMFASLHRYRPVRPFAAWVARLTTHRCSTHLVLLKRRRWFEHSDNGFDSAEHLTMVHHAIHGDAGRDGCESTRLCRDLLSSVRASDRALLTLRYVEGLSADEVAQRNGLSAGAVRVRVCRASRALRAKLWYRGKGIVIGIARLK